MKMQGASTSGSGPISCEVQTQRLKLREPDEKDASELTRLIGDWEVSKWLARVPYPYALDDARVFIENVRATASSGYGANFFVDLDGALIGGAGLTGENANTLELGYWIAREHWGFGYATEAAAGLINYAETRLGCTRIEASYQNDNAASAWVLRKLGFRQCGEKSTFSLARNFHVRSTCVFLDLRH